MYRHSASGTKCGVGVSDTASILCYMTNEDWKARARRRMTELKITQEMLKKVFKVKTRGAVGHYLSGRREPNPLQIVNLADELNCSLDWLLRGEGPVTRELQTTSVSELTHESRNLALRWQNLPIAAQLQVYEFLALQLQLMDDYQDIFVRTKGEKSFYEVLAKKRAQEQKSTRSKTKTH